jgi:phospholipase/carboxylesterase
VVLLHGVRSNERDLFGLAASLDPRLQVISLRGPITFAPGAYGWFNVSWEDGVPVHDEADAERSTALLAGVPSELAVVYGVDPAKVIYVGFSQGAIITMSVLLGHPGLLAGAVLMSPRTLPEVVPPGPIPALRGFPVMQVHGRHDPVLPLVPYGQRTREVLEAMGTDLTYREYDMGHEVSAQSWADVRAWLSARM